MKKYKQLLIEEEDLMRQGVGLAHDRVSKLVAVFNDKDFRADHDLDEVSAAEWLDHRVADLGYPFGVLKRVIELYPERDQWTGRTIYKMVGEALDEERRRKQEAQGEQKKAQRVTVAQYRELQQEKEELSQRVGELEEQNRELARQVAVAEYKISELEECLKKESATA